MFFKIRIYDDRYSCTCGANELGLKNDSFIKAYEHSKLHQFRGISDMRKHPLQKNVRL